MLWNLSAYVKRKLLPYHNNLNVSSSKCRSYFNHGSTVHLSSLYLTFTQDAGDLWDRVKSQLETLNCDNVIIYMLVYNYSLWIFIPLSFCYAKKLPKLNIKTNIWNRMFLIVSNFQILSLCVMSFESVL